MLTKKVIFMSAQPDVPYFHWQVEVMIHNFMKSGINPNWIEVLWAHPGTPSPELLALARKYSYVRFFMYKKSVPDNFGYIPILRPDILEQHFIRFPELRGDVIFYHDSDIIFRELPDFDSMHDDLFWYLSDTISYIGSNYIKSKSPELFAELCEISNVSPILVQENQMNSGGAQHLMKFVNAEYWKNVKNDALAMYKYMAQKETQERILLMEEIANDKRLLNEEMISGDITLTNEEFNERILKIDEKLKKYNPIQKWCADMWAVLWGALKIGAQPRISPGLSFSWGTSTLADYENHNIMHNAGVTTNQDGTLFYKGEFINQNPFIADFSKINPNTASAKYVEAILYVKEHQG